MLFDFEMFGRISAEQRVALMLHSLNGRGWSGKYSLSSPTYNLNAALSRRARWLHYNKLRPFTASADLKIPDWDRDYSSYPIPNSGLAALD